MQTNNEEENRTIGEEDKRENQSVTKNEVSMPGNVSARKDTDNKGSQPSGPIPNGGGGERRQPAEHTGQNTEMGGATGGTPGMPDASDGNDNTTTATTPEKP